MVYENTTHVMATNIKNTWITLNELEEEMTGRNFKLDRHLEQN